MTKILLINPIIREHEPPISFPIGIGIIANIMLQNDFEVVVFDHNALRRDISTMISELKKIKDVDIVGIGEMITVYSSLKITVPIIRDIFPQAKIVIGGGVTLEPDIIFENVKGVDFCVHGEGEHTFFELCNHLRENKNDFEKINGISFIKEQQLHKTPPRRIERNLDIFPMPAYHLFPTEIYLKNPRFSDGGSYKRQATIIASRGCPNKCSFCWRMAGPGIRFRSVEKILEEIQYLKSNYHIDSMFFLDECINASEKRVAEICNGLLENKVNLPWISHARADRIDPGTLKLMKESGCIWLSVGLESGSDEMLKKMNKNVTAEQNKKAGIFIKQAGIKVNTSMMVGMPGETKETIEQSIALLEKIKPDSHAYFITTPYPGCDLYYLPEVQKQILERYGSKDKFFEVLGDASELTINLTDFSDEELIMLRDYARSRVPRKKRFKATAIAVLVRTAKCVLPEKLLDWLRSNAWVQKIIR